MGKYRYVFRVISLVFYKYVNVLSLSLSLKGYKYVHVLQNVLKDGFIDPILQG